VNEELLEEIIQSTKKTFKNMEESWELHRGGYKQYTDSQIEVMKNVLKGKDDILRKLEQMKRRMARYKEEI
jgi:predicted N-acyltransferase